MKVFDSRRTLNADILNSVRGWKAWLIFTLASLGIYSYAIFSPDPFVSQSYHLSHSYDRAIYEKLNYPREDFDIDSNPAFNVLVSSTKQTEQILMLGMLLRKKDDNAVQVQAKIEYSIFDSQNNILFMKVKKSVTFTCDEKRRELSDQIQLCHCDSLAFISHIQDSSYTFVVKFTTTDSIKESKVNDFVIYTTRVNQPNFEEICNKTIYGCLVLSVIGLVYYAYKYRQGQNDENINSESKWVLNMFVAFLILNNPIVHEATANKSYFLIMLNIIGSIYLTVLFFRRWTEILLHIGGPRFLNSAFSKINKILSVIYVILYAISFTILAFDIIENRAYSIQSDETALFLMTYYSLLAVVVAWLIMILYISIRIFTNLSAYANRKKNTFFVFLFFGVTQSLFVLTGSHFVINYNLARFVLFMGTSMIMCFFLNWIFSTSSYLDEIEFKPASAAVQNIEGKYQDLDESGAEETDKQSRKEGDIEMSTQ